MSVEMATDRAPGCQAYIIIIIIVVHVEAGQRQKVVVVEGKQGGQRL